MPRTVELRYFANLIASLTITAARTDDVETLGRIEHELEEAFVDVFALLSHDALVDRPTALPVEALMAVLTTDGGTR